MEGVESLSQDFNIIVVSQLFSAFARTFVDSVDHGLLGALEEQNVGHVDVRCEDFGEALDVIIVPGETVDQKLTLIPTVFLHGFFEQVYRYFNWDDFSSENLLIYEGAVFAATVSFFTKEVPSAQMDKAIISD